MAKQAAQRILVTGGAGFIGSQIVEALLQRGCEVLVIDDLSSGRRENVGAAADLHRLDIRDSALRQVFAEFRPEVMYHLAAQMDVRKSVEDPLHDADVNIAGSLRLLECCREFGTGRVIFSSTGGAIYGEQDEYPAGEDHPQRPCSPYGVAKLAVEKYLHFYAVTYGLRTTALRYANVYGPRQNPHGEAGVVAIFFDRLLKGETPTIFGDGEQTRDYVFVGDVVAANLAALDRELTGAYNVGSGVETTVNELYRLIRTSLASERAAEFAPGKPGEQRRSCLDSRSLHRATGWSACVPLEQGIEATRDHFRRSPPVVST